MWTRPMLRFGINLLALFALGVALATFGGLIRW